MKKVFVLFTVVMLMAVMAWEKQSGKPVESEFLLDNVEALAAGESGYDTCLDADYKVVTYIDSVGCTSCKLQLPRWKQFMQEVDSTLNRPIPFVFYFHPKDMKELRYITRRDVFTYPVCFDEMDDFNQLNHFPGEMTFQTFLLDKDNKVVAIGNPVHNPKVKELYLKVLTGGELGKAETPMTKVSLDVTSIDFGSFPQSEKQERKFTLTNTGNNLLVRRLPFIAMQIILHFV